MARAPRMRSRSSSRVWQLQTFHPLGPCEPHCGCPCLTASCWPAFRVFISQRYSLWSERTATGSHRSGYISGCRSSAHDRRRCNPLYSSRTARMVALSWGVVSYRPTGASSSSPLCQCALPPHGANAPVRIGHTAPAFCQLPSLPPLLAIPWCQHVEAVGLARSSIRAPDACVYSHRMCGCLTSGHDPWLSPCAVPTSRQEVHPNTRCAHPPRIAGIWGCRPTGMTRRRYRTRGCISHSILRAFGPSPPSSRLPARA